MYGITGKSLLFSVLGWKIVSSQSSTTRSSSASSTHTLFSVPSSADYGQPILPNIRNETAINAQDVCPGYRALGIDRYPLGFTARLTLAGQACNAYGTDIDMLNLSVQYQSADRLEVEIGPTYIDSSNTSHYITPPESLNKPGPDIDAEQSVLLNELLLLWGNEPSFWFKVVRKPTGEELFSTQGNQLVFEDQFVEIRSKLPTAYNLYGLGETVRPFRLSNNFNKTMYATDAADPIDGNIYGTFPVYYDTRYYEVDDHGTMTYVPWNETSLDKRYISKSHGVYYRNPHGHEILLQSESITWRTIGGNLDLYFYAGPTVEDVSKSFQTSTIGLPVEQQYFTLGYHQCRWGYNNWSEVEGVVNDFEKFGLPLENMWTDIDYLDLFRDFTTDPERYPQDEGHRFLDALHASGRHYIPITDAPIYIPNPDNASDAYDTFTRGDEAQAFMTNPDGSTYIGALWPGYTVFPDWLSEGAADWWTNEVVMFHGNLSFDGLWIDISEVGSFCVGSCGSGNLSLNPAPGGISSSPIVEYPEGFSITNQSEAASASSASASEAATSMSTTQTTSYLVTTPTPGVRNVNHPPYAINNVNEDLAVHAVSPNATHRNDVKTQEYDVHSLFGYQILNATYNALSAVFPGKRPFIIGRSTFAGAGSVAGHWGGDNTSKWYYMVFSISHALSMSLFGIPMFGVDTCGFNGNTDEELCNRWMQLSAFFPFYRNHNAIHAISQEPYRWESVIDATKTAIQIRYSLLPYMYTLFHLAHTTGSTVMRALQWEFPNIPSLANADHQFLLGPSILVTPCLTQGATSVSGVFPSSQHGTVWYDWYNSSAITDPAALAGQNVSIPAPLGHIPVFIRGGRVLPLQPPRGALTTRDARTMPWTVLVGLDANGAASGSLYLDDGESVRPNATLVVSFVAGRSTLCASERGKWKEKPPLHAVKVMGVAASVVRVTLNGMDVKAANGTFEYDSSSKLLTVAGLDGLTSAGAWSRDWTLAWR